MKLSTAGIKFIKREEAPNGEAVLEAYEDTGGVWTIGFGCIDPRYAFEGNTITKTQAEKLLKEDLKDSEKTVNMIVKVQLTQNQYDSLVSLCFNIGDEAFSSSTLLKKLNKSDFAGAANEFPRWKYDNGKVIKGLVARRARERALFLTPMGKSATPEQHESDIIPEAPGTRYKGIAGVGATGVAGVLSEAATKASGMAQYGDYFKILVFVIFVLAVIYTIKEMKDE